MRAHYDFSKMKAQRNPYAARLKQPITIRLDKHTVSYFKELADEVGMPYQNLINRAAACRARLPDGRVRRDREEREFEEGEAAKGERGEAGFRSRGHRVGEDSRRQLHDGLGHGRLGGAGPSGDAEGL